MITTLTLCLIKLADNAISTLKNITLYNGKYFLSALLSSISQLFFFLIVAQISSSTSLLTMLLISLSAGIGSYIVSLVNHYYAPDKLYLNLISSPTPEAVKEMVLYLKAHEVHYILFPSYYKGEDETFSILIFAKTKYQSKLIDTLIEHAPHKYLREII